MNPYPGRLVVVPIVLRALCAMTLVMWGCGESPEGGKAGDEHVLILGASSTQDALEQMAGVLKKQGGPTLTVSASGSNAIAQQIVAGAPGDLFLSAHQQWVDEIAKHGHVTQTVSLLSGNLVLVVPAGNPANVQGPSDLLKEPMRRLALAGERVPAGIYADQVLRRHNLYDPLSASARIVRGQNARFTLAYVERGEVDAGIVYASDAAAASNVQVVFTFDQKDHDPIVYQLVLLKGGQDRPAVRNVFEFLQSPQAGAIFEQHGFRTLSGRVGEAR